MVLALIRLHKLSSTMWCFVTPVKYDRLPALSETSLRLSKTLLNPQSVKHKWNESTRSTPADLKMIVSNTLQYVGPVRSNALELKKTLLSLICLLSWVFSCYDLYFSTHPLFQCCQSQYWYHCSFPIIFLLAFSEPISLHSAYFKSRQPTSSPFQSSIQAVIFILTTTSVWTLDAGILLLWWV